MHTHTHLQTYTLILHVWPAYLHLGVFHHHPGPMSPLPRIRHVRIHHRYKEINKSSRHTPPSTPSPHLSYYFQLTQYSLYCVKNFSQKKRKINRIPVLTYSPAHTHTQTWYCKFIWMRQNSRLIKRLPYSPPPALSRRLTCSAMKFFGSCLPTQLRSYHIPTTFGWLKRLIIVSYNVFFIFVFSFLNVNFVVFTLCFGAFYTSAIQTKKEERNVEEARRRKNENM